MKDVMLQDAPNQTILAQAIASEFNRFVPTKPESVRIAESGRFSVMVIGYHSVDLELRVLFFQSNLRQERLVVQINLTAQPLSASARRMEHTASYEELQSIFAGTPVMVLDSHTFTEFMREYDSMNDELQDLLDGVEHSEQPLPLRRRRVA